MKHIADQQIIITVKRPTGQIETIDVSAKFPCVTENFFKTNLYPGIVKNTASAGRGEVTGYTYADAIVEQEEKDFFEKCERCGKPVDIRTGYHQTEKTRFGGKAVEVEAYYCNDCAQLLSQIGAGEFTALDERKGNIDSIEMINKEEYK